MRLCAFKGRVFACFLQCLRFGTAEHQFVTILTNVEFHNAERLRDGFTQLVEHIFKHAERFGFIFIQRVALTERTQIDTLTQMVEVE